MFLRNWRIRLINTAVCLGKRNTMGPGCSRDNTTHVMQPKRFYNKLQLKVDISLFPLLTC